MFPSHLLAISFIIINISCIFGYFIPSNTHGRYLSESKRPLSSKLFDEDAILSISKDWIQAMICDFGICPYSKSSSLAGVPQGPVRYKISQAKSIDEAFEDYWSEVFNVLQTPPSDLVTVLLIYPYVDEFSAFDEFELFSEGLDRSVEQSCLGDDIDNVFFHPLYKFLDKDGQVFMIFDEDTGDIIGDSRSLSLPIDYARRSPWPIINILRATMVRAAQKNMPEGKVVERNKERLNSVGVNQLQHMLEALDWTQLNTSKKR